MQISRTALVGLFESLGFKTAKKWNKARFQKKIQALSEDIQTHPVHEDHVDLFNLLKGAKIEGMEITITNDAGTDTKPPVVDSPATSPPETTTEATKPEKPLKTQKKKPTKKVAPKKETKPPTKKQPARKKSKPPTKKVAPKKKAKPPTKESIPRKKSKPTTKKAPVKTQKKKPVTSKAAKKAKPKPLREGQRIQKFDRFGTGDKSQGFAINKLLTKGKSYTVRYISEEVGIYYERVWSHLRVLIRNNHIQRIASKRAGDPAKYKILI